MVEVKGWGMPFVSEGPTSIETCGVVCVCVWGWIGVGVWS